MANIIVVFPKPEDTQNICRLLRRGGYSVMGCTGPTSALQLVDELGEGIIVCGYRIRGMIYEELHSMLPPGFHMLLIASQQVIDSGLPKGVESLTMPLRMQELKDKLNEMQSTVSAERRARRTGRTHSVRQQEQIRLAKELLMAKHSMTEEEAHRYLQKTSMDSGRNMTETAGMIVSLMSDQQA